MKEQLRAHSRSPTGYSKASWALVLLGLHAFAQKIHEQMMTPGKIDWIEEAEIAQS
jgi:hypothetical protein